MAGITKRKRTQTPKAVVAQERRAQQSQRASRAPTNRQLRRPSARSARHVVEVDEEMADAESQDDEDGQADEDEEERETLAQLQLRTARRDEERKEELHQAQLRLLEAQANNRPGAQVHEDIDAEDDYGESSLSPAQRQQLCLFPGQHKKDVIAIIKNTFLPRNLPALDRNSSQEHEAELWSRTFLIYTAIVMAFFGAQFPTLGPKLIFFHNKIIKLAKTYKWQGAVLNLAIEFLERRVSAGITDTSAWEIDTALIDEYTRGHQLGPAPLANTSSSKPRQSFIDSSTNKAGIICQNFNKHKGCTTLGCKRDHLCETCGGSHPATDCETKASRKQSKQ